MKLMSKPPIYCPSVVRATWGMGRDVCVFYGELVFWWLMPKAAPFSEDEPLFPRPHLFLFLLWDTSPF